MSKAGRPKDARKDFWNERLGLNLTPSQRRRFTAKLIAQIERCADDDTRRVLFMACTFTKVNSRAPWRKQPRQRWQQSLKKERIDRMMELATHKPARRVA